MTAAERADRSRAADERCREALVAGLVGAGLAVDAPVALVAVGGYGRAELAPYSDLDVVLLHGEHTDVSRLARDVWYPLWDAGPTLDHSVRALPEVVATASADPRVALGLLDARHVAGDPSLALRLRADLLAHWRRHARAQLPDLWALGHARAERMGELGHVAVPDLKESLGGLRDATVLKALVATWLVDVPHSDLERSRLVLLDVRDELHVLHGRANDRVPPDLWADLAGRLGLGDAEAAQRRVRAAGRRITHLSRLTWRRVDAVLARPTSPRRRSPELERVAPGVAVSAGEVVLDARTDPAGDPLLLLRVAAEASERALALSPTTAARLVRRAPDLPCPWTEEARGLLTRLLAGPGLLQVWETLDETGSLERLLPEWERVRLLPHASVVHRFTVDRHMVETCIEAARLIRRVSRPDVLMVAALLHDIGKSSRGDHSVVGAPVAADVASRMGFDERECDLVGRLVRHHLLLPTTATTRDTEDPATVALVADRVVDRETLDLLAVLTEADARATSAQAWTSWRASLVADLVARVGHVLLGQPVPEADLVASRILVSDRVWVGDGVTASAWEVAQDDVDPAIVRQHLDAIGEGRVDPTARLRTTASTDLPARVLVRDAASEASTVLEVRVEDRPGVVYAVCRALAGLGVSVRSAHVSTVGPQAVDVFYVVEPTQQALNDDRVSAAVDAITAALAVTVTLDA